VKESVEKSRGELILNIEPAQTAPEMNINQPAENVEMKVESGEAHPE